ncbi:MAG: hypothetical protein WCB68_03565 [Pyrinomonadaceae bacterium]
MSRKSSAASLLSVAAILVLLLAGMCAPALAQCAMCKASLSGSNNAAFMRGFNLGVLVLLLPPVTIFSTIFIIAFRHRRAGEGKAEQSSKHKQ